jgi:hypothetical protein
VQGGGAGRAGHGLARAGRPRQGRFELGHARAVGDEVALQRCDHGGDVVVLDEVRP